MDTDNGGTGLGDRVDGPSLPSQGYWVRYGADGPGGQPAHEFCGANGEPSARCANCRKPLLRLLALDASDERLHVPGRGYSHLTLYYCWTCELSQGTFAYQVAAGGRVRLIEAKVGPSVAGFPYDDYPPRFPLADAWLELLTEDEQRWLRRLNLDGTADECLDLPRTQPHLVMPRHQVGGEPLLLQGWVEPECPICHLDAPLLATVANDCLDPRGIIGHEYAQLVYHFCRRCDVVIVHNVCD